MRLFVSGWRRKPNLLSFIRNWSLIRLLTTMSHLKQNRVEEAKGMCGIFPINLHPHSNPKGTATIEGCQNSLRLDLTRFQTHSSTLCPNTHLPLSPIRRVLSQIVCRLLACFDCGVLILPLSKCRLIPPFPPLLPSSGRPIRLVGKSEVYKTSSWSSRDDLDVAVHVL